MSTHRVFSFSPFSLTVALLLACSLSFSKPTRFEFKDAGLRNLVHFVSDAPLEKIVGLSNFVAGWIELDIDRLNDGVRGEFEVDLRTFETGIDSRNELLREKFLGASEYPLASFSIVRFVSVSKPKLTDSHPVSVKIEGVLKAKGVAKPQTVLAKLTYLREDEGTRQRLGGNLLKLSASLDVDIIQYNITLPDSLKARFAKFVQIYLDALGTDKLPSALPAVKSDGAKKEKKS